MNNLSEKLLECFIYVMAYLFFLPYEMFVFCVVSWDNCFSNKSSVEKEMVKIKEDDP